ncbi:hypothetical protein K402DRAFT_461290 [Aulographum hederae CBS 113979]|uniref:Uncharacterized protein n=1 Tax=Aulographum hederae CBS 113979 TaxID=1176131 RepID=A0A6G1H882_9PEZI|nr:hypothetical protein K402DRAFT_461290 [Aulographum hederae CBS 113979]
MIVRAGSSYDRAPPSSAGEVWNVLDAKADGLKIARENLYRVGVKIVEGVIREWEQGPKLGVGDGLVTEEYVGDILGTLGGKPAFGLGSAFGGKGANGTKGGVEGMYYMGMKVKAIAVEVLKE